MEVYSIGAMMVATGVVILGVMLIMRKPQKGRR